MSAHERKLIAQHSIDQALAVPIVSVAAKYTVLTKKGEVYWGKCPLPHHDEKTASFKVESGRANYRCFGKCSTSGDVIDLVMKCENVTFAQAVERLAGSVEYQTAPLTRERRQAQQPKEPDPNPRALRTWLQGIAITSTLGEFYLREHRGITTPLPDATLRFGRVWHHEERQEFPAVIAAIARPTDRKIIAAQCTFLTEDGRKAPIEHPRLTIGALGTGAIRLAPAGGELGLAEGFEKALAATQLTGIPCWSTVGASRFHKITLPACVHTVHLFSDNGEAGHAAAARAKDAYRATGRRVIVRFPPPEYADYDEITQAQARKVRT